MSNRALRAAMWSLLCAVCLVAAVSLGDPRALHDALALQHHRVGPLPETIQPEITQPALSPTTMIAKVDPTPLPPEEESPYFPPQLDSPFHKAANQPRTASTPSPLRVASTDLPNLQLDPEELTMPEVGTPVPAEPPHRDLLRPHPGDLEIAAIESQPDRRVPDPLLDPFDEPDAVAAIDTSNFINEQQAAAIAEQTIERKLAELRNQVVAAYQARQLNAPERNPRQDRPASNDSFVPPTANPQNVAAAPTMPISAGSPVPTKFRQASTASPSAAELGNGRFRLTLADASLPEVLRLLGDIGEKNIVSSADVEGTVKYNMQGVTVEQALEAIARIHGLSVEESDAFVFVSTADETNVKSRSRLGLPIVTPGPPRLITPQEPSDPWDGPVARDNDTSTTR